MSLESEVTENLAGNGLRQNEVADVLARVKQEMGAEGLLWSDPEGSYPMPMRVALRLRSNHHALAYLNEVAPMHFARFMFDPSLMAEGLDTPVADDVSTARKSEP